MPLYEYACRKCSHKFEAIVFGSKKPPCPTCGSRDLEKLISVFAVSTGTGKAAAREPAGACGSCGDPRGPGSCDTE